MVRGNLVNNVIRRRGCTSKMKSILYLMDDLPVKEWNSWDTSRCSKWCCQYLRCRLGHLIKQEPIPMGGSGNVKSANRSQYALGINVNELLRDFFLKTSEMEFFNY